MKKHYAKEIFWGEPMSRPRMLYIEDMKKCFDKTLEVFGKDYSITWAETPDEAIKEIQNNLEGINPYWLIISDVNLFYDPTKPDNKQTTEGLELIAFAREESKKKGIKKLPIICVSSLADHRKPALKNGANIFMWKKAFWGEKGEKYLSQTLRHHHKEYYDEIERRLMEDISDSSEMILMHR